MGSSDCQSGCPFFTHRKANYGIYNHTVNCFTRKQVYSKMISNGIGLTLVNLRKRAGVTQKELAQALGVTDHTVRNWEKGRSEAELQLWQVKQMCLTLRCDVFELPDKFKIEEEDSASTT